MLRLNFLLAIRSLIRTRTTSFINVTGLAVSFTNPTTHRTVHQQELNMTSIMLVMPIGYFAYLVSPWIARQYRESF